MAPSATHEMMTLISTTANNVKHMTESIADLKRAVETNQQKISDVATQVSLLDASVKVANDNQAKLFKIIRDGNGQPSVLDRLTVVEAKLEHIEEDIDEMRRVVEEVKVAVDNFQTAKTVSRGQFITAISSMVLACCMSLWAVIAQIMKP